MGIRLSMFPIITIFISLSAMEQQRAVVSIAPMAASNKQQIQEQQLVQALEKRDLVTFFELAEKAKEDICIGKVALANGVTALHIAAEQGDVSAINRLIDDYGASPDVQTYQFELGKRR